MLQRCACDAYDVEANGCTYVREGHPICAAQTCAKVKEHRAALLRYPTDNGQPDETVDHLPSQIYAR